MKAIRYERESVLIQDGNITAWVDIWIEKNDVICDWNQNEFALFDLKEQALKNWQDNLSNFEEAISIGLKTLEKRGVLYQDINAKWHHTELYKALKGVTDIK